LSKTSLSKLRDSLAKTYGEERVTVPEPSVEQYTVTTTGSLTLDYALGVGGWVGGRMHEIVGVEGVGKTTLTLRSLAALQRAYPDKAVAYIDMEQTFDVKWAIANGLDLDPDRFIPLQPDHAEDVSDMLRQVCDGGDVCGAAVDSIGGMESKKALEKEAEEVTMGRNAQVITRMVKNTATLARRNNVTVLLVNQYRANIASPKGGDISAGPKALRYATSTKVAMRRTGEPAVRLKVHGEEEEVSRQVRARVERNKVAPQGRVATFWIVNQEVPDAGLHIGIDQADEAISLGTMTGVIGQRGAWYDLPSGEKCNGRAKALEILRASDAEVQAVRTAALKILGGQA
jgi:recombination protein RecA